jgi:hypothetical protein
MHACKSISSINSSNNYYITFDYLSKNRDDTQSEININSIVNCIRLNYKINNTPFIVEYDNIEHEIIKSTSTIMSTSTGTSTTTLITSKLITYKLILKKFNDKLKLLPANTDAEITIFFKKEIDNPALVIAN